MTLVCGDAVAVLTKVPSGGVKLTITSPPYFRHRDYGMSRQIGQERTVEAYIIRLGDVLRELYRVTEDDGSCFVVIGDTYRQGSLCLVPHRMALAAASVGWIVRNDIIWQKLDASPDGASNRWRSGHEHVLFLAKSASGYVFHTDAVRQPYAAATLSRWGKGQVYGGPKSKDRTTGNGPRLRHGKTFGLNSKGCIPTDVWALPTPNNSARHYATFPEGLVERAVLACSSPGDLVLDPFVGVGTTCAVAQRLGRRSLGIELNPDYARIGAELLGITAQSELV